MTKERILPWTKEGRWYHFFIESTGSTIKITDKDDIDASVNGTTLHFPDGFRALNWVVDHDNAADTSGTYACSKSLYTDGSVGIALPKAAQFTAAEVYVFGYFK